MLRVLRTGKPNGGQIFWFPHAGAGPSSLVRGAKSVNGDFSLLAASLPGREDRYKEGFSASLDDIIGQFQKTICSEITGPYGFVGHSFGSLIAFLLAQRFAEADNPPRFLAVQTLTSPDRIQYIQSVASKTDEEFIDYIDNRFGGIPDSLKQHKEAMELFLPIVRYDMQLLESYEFDHPDPLPIPMIALGGTDDRAVSRAELDGWSLFTSESFSLRILPGDHFFPVQQMQKVLSLCAPFLQQPAAS